MADSFAPPGSELSKIGVAAFPTAGQGLALDTSGSIPREVVGNLKVLTKDFTETAASSSASEVTLFSQNVFANLMGSTGAIRLTVGGYWIHNNAGADTITPRVKFGGTTFWGNASSLGGTADASFHPWCLTATFANTGLTNRQTLYGNLITERSDVASPTVAGIGGALVSTGNTLHLPIGVSTSGTIDTGLDQIIAVTATWSASSANNVWRKTYAMLELF